MKAAAKRVVRKVFAGVAEVPGLRDALRPLSLSGRLTPQLWGRLPPPETFLVPVKPGAEYRYRASAGDPNKGLLYWRGGLACEPGALSVVLACLGSMDVFVDIGANSGRYSLAVLAAKPAVSVVAFEALPRIAERLAVNVDSNGWSERFTLHRVAAGAEEGEAAFVDPGQDHPTTGRLASAKYISKRPTPNATTVSVPVRRVDDILADIDGAVFFKVDVEGAEHFVLSGALGVLGRTQAPVLFEMHPEGPVAELRALFEELGYDTFLIQDDGTLTPSPGLEGDWSRANRDYLAVPRRAHAFVPAVRALVRDDT